MEKIDKFLSVTFLGIEANTYLVVLILIFAGFISKLLVKSLFKKASGFVKKTKIRLDDIVFESLSKPVSWLVLLFFLYLAFSYLPLPEKPINFNYLLTALFKGSVVLVCIWLALRLLNASMDYWLELAKDNDNDIDDQLVPVVRSTGKVFIIAFGIVLFLQNLGYSVSSLVAGLGIGGAAVAFASKDTLSNLFGSVVVFMDRPFRLGDYVLVADVEGSIEEIGVRSTKIRTLANTLVSIPNSDFTIKSIVNFSKRQKRQIRFELGLTYSSTPDKIKELVQSIKNIIKEEDYLYDECIVSLNNFNSSSLDIFINCYTKTIVWKDYHEDKEKFMLRIMKAVSDLNLDFAFPTQTLHVESLPKN